MELDAALSLPFFVTPVMNIRNEWGEVANLRGLVSSLTIFGDSLSAGNVKTLYKKGTSV